MLIHFIKWWQNFDFLFLYSYSVHCSTKIPLSCLNVQNNIFIITKNNSITCFFMLMCYDFSSYYVSTFNFYPLINYANTELWCWEMLRTNNWDFITITLEWFVLFYFSFIFCFVILIYKLFLMVRKLQWKRHSHLIAPGLKWLKLFIIALTFALQRFHFFCLVSIWFNDDDDEAFKYIFL